MAPPLLLLLLLAGATAPAQEARRRGISTEERFLRLETPDDAQSALHRDIRYADIRDIDPNLPTRNHNTAPIFKGTLRTTEREGQ